MTVDPWCVLLASRSNADLAAITAPVLRWEPKIGSPPRDRAIRIAQEPLTDALRRAAEIASLDRIGAVVDETAPRSQRSALSDIPAANIFSQPRHQGTAHEVLLALLQLEDRISSATPVVFLPSDHTVADESVLMKALANLIECIDANTRPVYLLGAVPEGPHDQLGYIVPWHDAWHLPMTVYDFVEKPDIRNARKLINGGGLWNTFIFGGTVASMMALFNPAFDATIAAMRTALTHTTESAVARSLASIYERLNPRDFSHDVLAKCPDSLKVLRIPHCGWWPLKSPRGHTPLPA